MYVVLASARPQLHGFLATLRGEDVAAIKDEELPLPF